MFKDIVLAGKKESDSILKIIDRIELIRTKPSFYYTENINKITFDKNKDDIEDIIFILFAGSSKMDPDTFETLSNQLIEYEEFSGSIIYQYYYFTTRGSYFRYVNERKFALDCFEKANKLSYLINDTNLIVRSFIYISSIYSESEDYEMATHYSEQALYFFNKVSDPFVKADLLNNFGTSLYLLKEYSRSRDSIKKAYDIYRTLPDCETILNYVITILNLGDVESILENYDMADLYFQEGIEIAEKYSHTSYLVRNLAEIASYYERHGKNEKAMQYQKIYIGELERANNERSAIKLAYDKGRLKEETSTLKYLKKENEKLIIHMNHLYSKLDMELDEIEKRKRILLDLKVAFVREEIIGHYQPQYSMITGEITGAEVLARWIKPDGEIISPGIFIDLIEETDIIDVLSSTLIHEAFLLTKIILDKHNPDFIISVNIAPYQFIHHDVYKLITNEMLLSGISAKNIEIEITERTFLNRNPRVNQQLDALKQEGVRISLDDFGTGYSSLSCINSIAFDTIKVDGSLLINCPRDTRAKRLYSSITHLLKELEFHIVAEGVETEEQVQFLRTLNCDTVQGYFYSKAVKRDTFLKLMDSSIR